MNTKRLQRNVFLLLLVSVTCAFAWVMSPFITAVFWAVALALLFHGVFNRVQILLKGRRNLAAALTVALIVLIVVTPAILVAVAAADEAARFSLRMRSGEIDFHGYFNQIAAIAPNWVPTVLERFGITSVSDAVNRLSAMLLQGGQFITTQAVSIGQNTVIWVINLGIILYLLFFFLRDGDAMEALIRRSTPMSPEQTQALLGKFATVVRATVKGNVVVALIQGFLGGLAFWALDIHGAVLWGALMALLSLLPAVGAVLIWAPAAIYLAVTGSIGQAIGLALWGLLVISMIDNLLRPLLVGKDTKLPDWIVLLSTLGGISLFGISGFVVGPVIAALFMAAWTLFNQARDEILPEHDEATPQPPEIAATLPLPDIAALPEVTAPPEIDTPQPARPAPSATASTTGGDVRQ
ncbi:MAG: AI-2E family transporter [Burkholderiaceae bacterium]|jgi:predicted PurR-regulated permease PerM|nr:AI-2E family transporter [Burkholderiaceae bacterium]